MGVFGFLGDLAARQLFQRVLERPDVQGENQTRPMVDPLGQMLSTITQFGSRQHVIVGVIDDYISSAYCYRVRTTDGAGGPLLCVQGTVGSFGAFGAKDVGVLTPGATVVVAKMTQSYGVIIGVVPFHAYDPRRCLSDQISYATRTRVDAGHRKPLTIGNQRNAINWIANRPHDVVAGTQGWITARGMRILISDAYAQLGGGDACNITAFYNDMLLRLTGYNFELRTCAREHMQLNDQEELHDYLGQCVYPWEQLGLLQIGDPRRKIEPQAFQISEPWYAVWEPKDDKQQPFHRLQEFQGYLGQGGMRTLVGPPASPPEYLKLEEKQDIPGLARDFTTLAGARVISAAHSISLIKRITLPNPYRMMKPEDGRGDKKENYKHSGQLGGGKAHKITDMPKLSGEHKHFTLAAAILDLHAYLCNWSALHPFHYHEKDWDLLEEADVKFDGPLITQYQFDYAKLIGTNCLEPPSPKTLKIDERYGNVEFYETMSHFTQLPDGGITIGDGYGAEIRLSGGNLYLSAPGDVFLKSGRNVVTWAGWDATTRAQNSVDLSATKHDVRLKAGKNLQIMAEKGGVLIESQATEVTYDYAQPGEQVVASGIVFRAAKSEVVTVGSAIYLRTGSEDKSVLSGPIVIDADRGKAPLVVHAQRINSFVQQDVSFNFGPDGKIEKAIKLGAERCTFSSQIYADDGLVSGQHLTINGNVLVADGQIYAEQLPVGELTGEALTQVKNALAVLTELSEVTTPELAANDYKTIPEERFYGSGKAGEDTTLRQTGFSFRKTEEYLSTGFLVYEDRWQQLARAKGWGTVWKELPVKTPSGEETYPYPGREAFTGDNYYEQPLELFDPAAGYSTARGGKYEDPKFAAPTKRSLNAYPVIKQSE
jgi:hypothetical protein